MMEKEEFVKLDLSPKDLVCVDTNKLKRKLGSVRLCLRDTFYSSSVLCLQIKENYQDEDAEMYIPLIFITNIEIVKKDFWK